MNYSAISAKKRSTSENKFYHISLTFFILLSISFLIGSNSMAALESAVPFRNGNHNAGTARPSSGYGSIELSWLAPGDDGDTGAAQYYIIKYSLSPINAINWDSATTAAGAPEPLPAGTPQSCTITGLERGRRYYVAMKAVDDCNNCSPLSEVVSVIASGLATPAPVRTEIDTINGTAVAVARKIEAPLPVYYQFELDTIFSFDNPLLQVGMVADSLVSATYGSLHDGVMYFWRCRAVASDHSDTSDWSYFSMFEMNVHDGNSPTVRVIAPNGGETLVAGSSFNIVWSDSDNVGVTAHRIEYSTNAGSTWSLIRDWTSGSPKTYQWLVPNMVTNRARIRIFCRDAAGNVGSDFSDANFTIRQAGSFIDDRYEGIPDHYILAPAYPNPFNSKAVIYFGLPQSGEAVVEIFDGLGRRVMIIAEGYFEAGWHKVTFDAGNLPSGVYFNRVTTAEFSEVNKLLLLK